MNELKRLFRCLWFWLGLIALGIVSVIVLGEIHWLQCKIFNPILLNISYSIIAASVFFFVNDYLPQRKRNDLTTVFAQNQISEIGRQLQLMLQQPWIFCFEDIFKWDEDKFVKEFRNADLSGGTAERIREIARKIKLSCDVLMASYLPYLTSAQMDFIKAIYFSELISSGLDEINYDIPEEVRPTDNNQERIGREIYRLYRMKRT